MNRIRDSTRTVSGHDVARLSGQVGLGFGRWVWWVLAEWCRIYQSAEFGSLDALALASEFLHAEPAAGEALSLWRVPWKELIQDLGRFAKRGHDDGIDPSDVAEHIHQEFLGLLHEFRPAVGA